MRRATLTAALLLAVAAPARGQLVVVDPLNLAQAIVIAERTLREYQTLRAQYETIVRIVAAPRPHGGLSRADNLNQRA